MPYLVDGHNLMGQIPGLTLANPEDRQRLVQRLCSFARARGCRITIIFDGEPPKGWRSDAALGDVRARHPGRGRSADEVILDAIHRSSAPADITLVTSDRSLAEKARHLGARGIPGTRFLRMMGEVARGEAGAAEEKPGPPAQDELDGWLEEFSAAKRADSSRSRKRR